MNLKVLLTSFNEETDTLTFEVRFTFFSNFEPYTCILHGTAKAIRRFHYGLKKEVVSINSYEDFPAPVRHTLDSIQLNALFQALNSFNLNYYK